MKIAFLGTRGIPASYSGFETCVEQLGQRLAERGHHISVYCRSHHIQYREKTYKGMRLIRLPTIRNKYLDTIVHTFLSSIHALFQRYDVAMYFIAGNSPVSWIPRIAGTRTVLNVDGLDWRREKWPALAKRYIQAAEFLATILPNRFFTDSRAVANYYQKKYNTDPPYIPYGSDIDRMPPGPTLANLNLEPRKYILFVGRLVPENCAHHLVEAFRGLDTEMKCVIVGDAPYAKDYQQLLKSIAKDDSRILFPGYVFNEGYRELGSHAYAFIESSGVGGTHPALIEAMALGNCVVVYDTPENLETMGNCGFFYDGKAGADSLRIVLQKLLQSPDEVQKYRELARKRAMEHYSWNAVTDAHEKMFTELITKWN